MAGRKVVFVGELYDPTLSIGGGPIMPGEPPGIWPSPGHPAHPIAPGGRPPGIWGGAPPYVDIGGPGPQPVPTPPIYIPPGFVDGKPEHPIYFPPGVWVPTFPTQPIYLPDPGPGVPVLPAHPIVIPPGAIDGEHPEHPIVIVPPGIWGGAPIPVPTPPIHYPPPGEEKPPGIWPSPGHPAHPIVIPPPESGTPPSVMENWDVKTAWSAETGWVVAIVPSGEHPGVPTPSRRRSSSST
jgi:hypothetical protein